MITKLKKGWFLASYFNQHSTLYNKDKEVIYCFNYVPSKKYIEDFKKIYERGFLRGRNNTLTEYNNKLKDFIKFNYE